MLKVVSIGEDLIQATVDEIMSTDKRDFSRLTVVTPSKRMLFFIRDSLNGRIKDSFFPPEFFTIDQFVFQLFNLNHSGFRMANEMEAVLVVFETIKKGFKDFIYTGGKVGSQFSDFFPWALIILKAIEELLIEGEFIDQLNKDIFQEFASLGEYHQGYKDFIGKMPFMVQQFKHILLERRQYTRGIAYKMTASLAEVNELKIPGGTEVIFSGLGALNACEERIIKFIFNTGRARLLVHCDPAALENQESPFSLVAQMLDSLNLRQELNDGNTTEWNRFSGKVNLYCLPNIETQMIQVVDIMKDIVASNKHPEDLKKCAVVLPDSATLIPFVHGVVSRLSINQKQIPFNITLGYPFRRTPLYQLLVFMMKVAESRREGDVFSPDYLNLIRHPYVKLSSEIGSEEEPLKRGIHLIEDLLNRENLLYFRPAYIEDKISGILQKSAELSSDLQENIINEVKNLHKTFLADNEISLLELAEFLKQAVLAIGNYQRFHLFLGDYVTAAVHTLDLVIQFAREHETDISGADFKSIVSLLSYHFSGVHIYFEGSPLKGIQVMGMLESRGLCFDEVIVVDAQEGVLPQSFKYDPLLPYDIRKAFGIRNYSQWETIFAFNFFSLIGSAKKAHILWVDKQEGIERPEKSRFIERIIYEMEKQDQISPQIVRKNFSCEMVPSMLKSIIKNDPIKEKINKMSFSASALESYVRCPLRFYYSYIRGLEERIELSVEPDVGELGILVHQVLEKFYQSYYIDASLDQMENQLERIIVAEFKNKGFSTSSGIGKIRAWVIAEKLRDFITTDIQRLRKDNIQISGFEERVTMDVSFSFSDSQVTIKGRIDRTERQGELVRLIDYKTGTPFNPGIRDRMINFRLNELCNLSDLEFLTALKELHNLYKNFQLLLYTSMTDFHTEDYSRIDAAYIFLKPGEDFFRPVFVQGSKREPISPEFKTILMKNFKHNLFEIIRDIFKRKTFPANPQDSQYCSYCPFRVPCGNV